MPEFHGSDEEEVGMFIKKFETACQLQHVPKDDYVAHCSMLLKDSAEAWWERREVHANETWDNLKADMKKEFRPAGSLEFRQSQLRERP